MKKIAVLSLVMILMALLAANVFADAEFTVLESNLIIYDDDDDGFFFGKVQNTGDTAGYYMYGVLDILDADGNAFITKKYVASTPSGIYLEPGETVYVRDSIWDKTLLETRPSDYNFSVSAEKYGNKYHTIPCEAEYYYSEQEKYDCSIFVTFTNNSDVLLHDIHVMAAIYDTEGALVDVSSISPSEIAVHPGGTVTVMIQIYSNLVEHFISHGITPDRIEGYVYIKD